MAYITTSHRPGIIEVLRGAVERLRAARARRAVYVATLNELVALSDRDLADLGITRAEIRTLAHEHAYGA